MIRVAELRDVGRLLEIYAPYVTDTAITLEYDVPSPEAFQARYERICAQYPWLVWEEDGRVLGYAYADRALERAAYQWDADLSIYLDGSARGRGIGAALYECLIDQLRALGYCNLYALITGSNETSLRFHERFGFKSQGRLARSGYKFGVWHDVYWYALRLEENMIRPRPPRRFVGELLR